MYVTWARRAHPTFPPGGGRECGANSETPKWSDRLWSVRADRDLAEISREKCSVFWLRKAAERRSLSAPDAAPAAAAVPATPALVPITSAQ